MQDDWQKHTVEVEFTVSKTFEVDVPMDDYADWLEGGGTGGVAAFLQEGFEQGDPSFHIPPIDQRDWNIDTFDISSADPIASEVKL